MANKDTALKSPALLAQYANVGGVASPSTEEEHADFLADEQKKWRKVVTDIGL